MQEAVLTLHKEKQKMAVTAGYYAAQIKEYSEQMKALEKKRDELQSKAIKYAEVKVWLDTFIDQTMQSGDTDRIDGTTFKMLVDKIIVRNSGIEVQFKCGVSITKEYEK